jgi:hypothetical protein
MKQVSDALSAHRLVLERDDRQLSPLKSTYMSSDSDLLLNPNRRPHKNGAVRAFDLAPRMHNRDEANAVTKSAQNVCV